MPSFSEIKSSFNNIFKNNSDDNCLKDGTDINIIECAFDNEYMQTILSDIKRFIDFYRSFMKNHKMKLELLQNEDEIDF